MMGNVVFVCLCGKANSKQTNNNQTLMCEHKDVVLVLQKKMRSCFGKFTLTNAKKENAPMLNKKEPKITISIRGSKL